MITAMSNVPEVQHILFITSSRIGDAVLSSGLLDHIEREYEAAQVTIACGPLVMSLFEGYPQVKRIIPLKKQKHHKHWIALWRVVVGTHWNIVIDLRNSAVSRLVRARKRYIYGGHIDKGQHKVEQNAAVMGLTPLPAPSLWFTDEQKDKARTLIPEGGVVLGIGPTANWIGKTWPAEHFIDVVNWLTGKGGLMEGARVAVFAAPGEEEAARQVLANVREDRQLDLIAKTDPGTAAAALSLCNFYIGNDSGLMHCAASVGTPTLGLFGPSYPQIYRPWGAHTAFVSTPETIDELIGYEGYDPKTCGCLMETLSVEAVKEQIQKSWPNVMANS